VKEIINEAVSEGQQQQKRGDRRNKVGDILLATTRLTESFGAKIYTRDYNQCKITTIIKREPQSA
jgi:hypothetical protein